MAFIDIEDPKRRDEIVAEYVATIRNVQQRNEDEKAVGLAKQETIEKTFNPIVKSTEKSTEAIVKGLKKINEQIEKKSNLTPITVSRKRVWNEQTGYNAIEYYLTKYDKKNIDKYFSIQRFGEDDYRMGEKEIEVDGNSNITVDNTTYRGTPGLWALIMLVSPKTTSYTEQDLEVYRELALQTDVMDHPQNIQKGGRPNTTTKAKMLKSFLEEGEGSGIQFLPGDIRGLSTKLNLLLAEFHAGNTSTRNEIVSILDELKKRKKITREEYNDINTFLASTL